MPKLRPITITDAKLFIARHHRHNDAPKSGLFAVGCEEGGVTCGVAIVGRPRARMKQDGLTCEVTHLATDGTRNACSILYAAAARAALALGYAEITTLVLDSEPGTSLQAAGWDEVAKVRAEKTWARAGRDRMQTDMFGERRPSGAKVRWSKQLRRKPAKNRQAGEIERKA